MTINQQKLTQPSTSTPEQPSPKRPSQLLSRSQEQAQQAADKTKIALVAGHQERLVALSASLDKAEQRREDILERLSDRVAFLQDDSLFMNDLLHRTQKKLKGNQTKEQKEVTTTAIDALCDAFDAVADWELPAIAPSSVMGALPL
jgi:hypothetical protein